MRTSANALKSLLQQLKLLIEKGQYIENNLTERPNKVQSLILKFTHLLTDTDSSYFCIDAKVFISNKYMTLAQLINNITDADGNKPSRSGCEARLLNSAQKFENDFGNTIVEMLNGKIKATLPELNKAELKLLSIEQDFDFKNNALDAMLDKFGINIEDNTGFAQPLDEIKQEDLKNFIELIYPYTEQGLKDTRTEMKKYGHIIWAFRKAILNGNSETLVSTILKTIQHEEVQI